MLRNSRKHEQIKKSLKNNAKEHRRKQKMENITQNVAQQSVKPNVNQESNNPLFIKKQTIKTKINELGCQVGVDFYSRFNEFLEGAIVKAIFRTKCNRRKTVRGMDI